MATTSKPRRCYFFEKTLAWNSHAQPLIDRGLPVIFWSLVKYEEPDFWRWSACDFLRTLGVHVCTDWGGTYEIKRDGRGCGVDSDLVPGEEITAVELCFDARRLLVAHGRVCENTRHKGMPHCESSALLEFRDLPGLIENISREHVVILYGDCLREFEILAQVLGLRCYTF